MDLRKPKVLFPLAAAVLAGYYTLPFLLKLTWWGVRDWDLFHTVAAVPAGILLHYGQFPFWNPYLSGGNILFHHPEVAILSPFFLLYLAFGAVVGLKLQVLIAYFLGFWGSMHLFRKLGMTPAVAIMGAVAYFGSVHFDLHFAEGHMPFTHYAFLPWFVYFILEGVEHRRAILGAAAALALMILGNGAAVILVYTMLFTSLLLLLRAIASRSWSEIRIFLLATALAIGVSAVKLLPMAVYMVQNRWEGNPEESIPLTALGSIFFGLNHSIYAKNFWPQPWAWHEYGAYLSPLLVGLAGYALVRHFRRQWYWGGLLILFLLLALGNFGAFSPWALLTGLPGFSSLRATGRAFHFVILAVTVLGGIGFVSLYTRAADVRRARLWRGLLWGAAGVIVVTNLALAWPILSEAFTIRPKHVDRSPVFRHVVDARPKMYENFLGNRGSLVSLWLSAYHPSRGLVGPGNVVMPEYVSAGEVEVISREYTPNRITYELHGGESGGRLMIGMGYDPGWRATDGRALTDTEGLITMPVEPGRQSVTVVYRTPYFYPGLVLSLLTMTGIVVWRRRLFPVAQGPDSP